MEKLNWKDIEFAVEVGTETDIYKKIVVQDNRLYLVVNRNTVKRITPKEFKRITGRGIRCIKKDIIRDDAYFIPLPRASQYYEKDLADDVGLYIETDHMQLVADGVYAEEMNIKQGGI